MFNVKIAGIIIGIDNRFELTHRICRNYICEGIPEFSVSVNDDEIEAEKGSVLSRVSDAYAESVCIYRAICRRMPEYGAFLFHSAVVECDGRAYAFAAPSGTGKSTHAALWLKYFGERARIINGDKPILRRDGEFFFAYGTPWCGKEGLNENDRSPLAAICFLERGKENRIVKLDSSESVGLLFPQILMPESETDVAMLFPLLSDLLGSVGCYRLTCDISEEAVMVAYNGMNNNMRGQ